MIGLLRIVAAGVLFALTAAAQHWTFQTYGTDVGLTNPNVLALHQDREGYLWVSTEGGLFRYDGDRFKAFETKTPTGSGATSALHTSADGQLWVATGAGLLRWDGRRLTPVPGFETTPLEGVQPVGSDASSLYVATLAGLWSMPLDGKSRPALAARESASSVYVAADSTVWFGCGSAVCSLTKGRLEHWDAGRGVARSAWQSIAEDSNGRLWIRSTDAIRVMDRSHAGFHPVRGIPKLRSTRGALLVPTRNGEMLIPHNSGLLSCAVDECRAYGAESGLRQGEMFSALEDREGSIWLGYSGHGLARWLGRGRWQSFTEREGLGNTSVWRIVRDSHGELWIGTSRGLYQAMYEHGRLRFRRSTIVGELTIYGLAAEPDGSLWIGTFQPGAKGLLRYYPESGRTIVYPPEVPAERFWVGDLARDERGTVWVATGNAVLRLPPGAAKLEAVPTPLDGASIFAVGRHGEHLVIGGKKGLLIERHGRRRLLTKADGLLDTAVQSVVRGPGGAVWLTYFAPVGISRIELNGDDVQMQHWTAEKGLPTNVVYSQFFDARGRHWLGTDSGVAILEGSRWLRYDATDGLVWNDCNAHSYLAEQDGTVWIGTSRGLARYAIPAQGNAELPATLITSVNRNEKPVETYDFDGATRSLAFRFTMLSYQRQSSSFRYRLKRDSEVWSHTSTHEARFAELPSGSYEFEVQGWTESGLWSDPAILPFRIRPPWFHTWEFRTLLVLAFVAAFRLWWRQRENRQRSIQAELERAVAERTRDLAEATARAEQASRVKGEFLANMSHEMRTPLNGVIGITSLALDLSTQPEVVEHLRIVQTSAKCLLGVINDVLDLSKMESGRMEIVQADLQVRTVVSDVISILTLPAREKALTLHSEVHSAVPEWVLGDENRLRQILVNLIGNAIKFTESGGVSVNVSKGDGQLQFSVTDTGAGIPEDKQVFIFDAFRQADNSISRRYGGTGLGLTISRKLVQAMGGSMHLESVVGKGSTFWFTVDAPATEHRRFAPPVSLQPTKASLRILVAEDNSVNQHLMRALLRKLGHQVTIASNGREAVAAWKAQKFDIILMDIQMPEMDGLEAVLAIRAAEQPDGEHIPVVALTARAMAGDRELFLASGMDEYLEKPIQAERLTQVLERVLAGGFSPSFESVPHPG